MQWTWPEPASQGLDHSWGDVYKLGTGQIPICLPLPLPNLKFHIRLAACQLEQVLQEAVGAAAEDEMFVRL